jgi:hypothetical protein
VISRRLESLKPAESEFWPTVRELMEAIRHHVQEEEDELFPQLRLACSQQ